MTSQPNAKQLVEELNKSRVEVSKLRTLLNDLDKEKESWFRKKEDCSKKVRESIQKIKEAKTKRDLTTKEIRELKLKRDSLNRGTSEQSKKFGDLKKGRVSIAKSLKIKESPSRIMQDIEKLEFKIETEPMSFDKEQAIMKKIKELKKRYGNASILFQINKKLDDSSDEIREMKMEANDAHRSVQEKARQSQSMHEQVLKLSAEIDKMKIEEQASFSKFSELKAKFNEANAQLKEKLKVMNGLKEQLDRIDSDRRERKKQEVETFLKSKEEEVNEKIRKRQKLTTEDLLVFQKFGKE
ncbi:hypothetical protein HYW20_00600 [Candidatus Woesearchaeota archaeon]|nr:hypothetical protein [Candidatus Woesearchaeota archaeon]